MLEYPKLIVKIVNTIPPQNLRLIHNLKEDNENFPHTLMKRREKNIEKMYFFYNIT